MLWTVVKSILDSTSSYRLFIYSGGNEEITEIIEKVKNIFGIDLRGYNIEIVRLKGLKWIEDKTYKFATLLGQFFGSIILMHEILSKKSVGLLLDTHGQPFGYFLARLCGIKTIAYVHYPLISSDMISKVREMRPSYNNSSAITSSRSISTLKLIYYYILLKWYQSNGLWCELALCNSSWTHGHIRSLWRCKSKILYPPCDVNNFLKIPLDSSKQPLAISVGQFRPEKDHHLQILAMASLLKKIPYIGPKLLLVGSCRNQEDTERVEELRAKTKELGIQENVEFHINVSYSTLIELLSNSMVGLHSMWNEHFGICVVELMASGLVTIAHNSAGPKLDIVNDGVDGFLATSPDEYANIMEKVFLDFDSYRGLRENAKKKVGIFSQEKFAEDIRKELMGYLSV